MNAPTHVHLLHTIHPHIPQAEVAGKRGLVPCNFLEDTTPGRNDGIEVFAADEDSMRIADRIIHKVLVMPAPGNVCVWYGTHAMGNVAM